MKHILGIIVILIVSTICGVIAKAAWYDQWSPAAAAPKQTMAWVKATTPKDVGDDKENAPNQRIAAIKADEGSKPATADISDDVKADDGATASDSSVDSSPEFTGGFPVAKLDMVVDHLTNGTANFIDAREEYEYDEGHLKSANLLPSSAIYENIENLMAVGIAPGAGGKPIIIYCGGGSCEASHNVAKAMSNDFGYQNIWIYVNGWEEVLNEPERFEGLLN